MLDASGWGQNSTESAGKTVSMSMDKDKGMVCCSARSRPADMLKAHRPVPDDRRPRNKALPTLCTNFEVAQLLLGISHPNGRLCSGFRCFKANPCRNSALIQLLRYLWFYPSSHTHIHIAALLHHHPIRCASLQLSPLSLWTICTREPRSGSTLTSSGKFIFSQLTSTYTEQTNER